MALDITSYLLSAQSPDAKIRTEAAAGLKQFQEQNTSGFLLSLAIELSHDGKPIESSRLAGIVLKNSLDAKDALTKEHLAQQWVAIDANVKWRKFKRRKRELQNWREIDVHVIAK